MIGCRCPLGWGSYLAGSVLGVRQVLTAAHGNSLRALVKILDNVPEEGRLTAGVDLHSDCVSLCLIF